MKYDVERDFNCVKKEFKKLGVTNVRKEFDKSRNTHVVIVELDAGTEPLSKVVKYLEKLNELLPNSEVWLDQKGKIVHLKATLSPSMVFI